MDLATYGYALAALLHSALALALLRDAGVKGGTPARWSLAAVGATAAWGWCAVAARLLAAPSASLAASAFDLLRYAMWTGALVSALRSSPGGRRPAAAAMLGPTAIALLAAELTLSVSQFLGLNAEGFLARLSFVSALSLPVFGLFLLEQLYRNVVEEARWATKPYCLALGIVFVFDIYFFSHAALFSQFDPDSVSVRGAIHALSVPLLLIASKRKPNRQGTLQLSRAAVVHTATLVLVGGYLLFIAATGYYVRRFGGSWGSALQLALLFAAAVLLSVVLLSGTMRAKLRVFVGKHFFSYRYDYRAEWLRFTAMLAASATPQDVGVSVVRGLADLVESPAGALWLKRAGDIEYAQLARWNMPFSAGKVAVGSNLTAFLRSKGWIVDIDEFRTVPRSYEGLTLPEWCALLPSAWLIVPLQVAEDLIGFVVLARARTAVQINWEVRDLLKTASRQAAGFLAQMHATEALLEARKFDAFHRMSAFVVHDLKNIVTQLTLMLKNAKRLQDNPEFQRDMLDTVEHSLEKMRQLMLQLREGATSNGSSAGVDLGPLLRRIAAEAERRGRSVQLRVADNVFTRGDEARIERVFGHIVQNAIDATGASDRVWIDMARSGGQAKVVLGDTGKGMSAEFVNNRLFKPFSSTKEGGMGIGAYESYQYVKELGGNITVESELGRGTIITILLPLLETQQRSDLELLDSR